MIGSLYKFVMLLRSSEEMVMLEKGNKGGEIRGKAKLEAKKNNKKIIIKKKTSYREKKSVMANLPLQHASLKNCLEISYINVIGFKIELLSNYGKASEEL